MGFYQVKTSGGGGSIKGLALCFINPSDNGESPRCIIERSLLLTQIRFISTLAPTASTTVSLYKNGTSIASFNTTTATLTYDVSPDVSLVPGDVLYAKFGAVNGIVNATVQMTVTEQ